MFFQFAFRSDPSRKFRFISRNFRGAETKLGTGQVQSKLFVVRNFEEYGSALILLWLGSAICTPSIQDGAEIRMADGTGCGFNDDRFPGRRSQKNLAEFPIEVFGLLMGHRINDGIGEEFESVG